MCMRVTGHLSSSQLGAGSAQNASSGSPLDPTPAHNVAGNHFGQNTTQQPSQKPTGEQPPGGPVMTWDENDEIPFLPMMGGPGGKNRRKPMSEVRVLKTPEGKVVRINLGTDTRMYCSPHNPPNTGTDYTRGDDLYVHKTRSGTNYFYIHHWSMWQGNEGGGVELIDEEDAREFLLDVAGLAGHAAMSREVFDLAEEYFPGIFEETG